MIASGAALIDSSERDDFYNGLKGLGFDSGDFQVVGGARADKPAGGGVQFLTQLVYVERTSTGIKRSYEAGHGHAWAAQALHDVNRKQFGSP